LLLDSSPTMCSGIGSLIVPTVVDLEYPVQVH
jgi:hypothetical protein